MTESLGLLRFMLVLIPLGLVCWAAMLAVLIWHRDDGGAPGRLADRIMDWVDGDNQGT